MTNIINLFFSPRHYYWVPFWWHTSITHKYNNRNHQKTIYDSPSNHIEVSMFLLIFHTSKIQSNASTGKSTCISPPFHRMVMWPRVWRGMCVTIQYVCNYIHIFTRMRYSFSICIIVFMQSRNQIWICVIVFMQSRYYYAFA